MTTYPTGLALGLGLELALLALPEVPALLHERATLDLTLDVVGHAVQLRKVKTKRLTYLFHFVQILK